MKAHQQSSGLSDLARVRAQIQDTGADAANLPNSKARAIFLPNGITLSGDSNSLYVADMLGVMVVDLRTGAAQDLVPDAHDTLAGIDGLYWYQGNLIGVQYGTAAYRVMRWSLAKGGPEVMASEVLERGTELVNDPTTGAIFQGHFYFMANTGKFFHPFEPPLPCSPFCLIPGQAVDAHGAQQAEPPTDAALDGRTPPPTRGWAWPP